MTYGYDLTGRLLQALDGSTTTPYTIGYDTAGWANSNTDQQGRNTQVQYDGVGNRTRLQWPANTNGSSAYFVTYSYDALNRMTEIDENGSPSAPLAKYQWDALSRLSLITYGDGTTDAYAQYDAGDNLQTLAMSFSGGTQNNVTFSYAWLKNHQRQSVGVNNSAFQYVPTTGTVNYSAANVNNGYTGAGAVNFTYDGNANLTYDGFNTLTYDVENRLISAQNGVVGQSLYSYDPLGHRSQKQSGGVTTQFVLAGNEEIADFTGTGVGTAQLLTVRGVGGLPVAAVQPATAGTAELIVYYHHDALGSTVAGTAPGQAAAEVFSYGEFGAPGAGSALTYRYAGYRYDNETGLYYVGARYYSPVLGRFVQTDPVGLKGGANLYGYAGNDPVNLTDPTGLCASTGKIPTAQTNIYYDDGTSEIGAVNVVGSSPSSSPSRNASILSTIGDAATALPYQFFAGFVNVLFNDDPRGLLQIGGSLAAAVGPQAIANAFAPATLYHFTSAEAAAAIRASGRLLPGGGLFGGGVYGSAFNSAAAARLMGAASVEAVVPFSGGLGAVASGFGPIVVPGAYRVIYPLSIFGGVPPLW